MAGYTAKPTGQRIRAANGVGLLSENQEGGLEGVLGVLLVAEDTPADAPHPWPMPAQEFSKRPLLAPADETFEQLSIGQPVVRRGAGQTLDVSQQVRLVSLVHGPGLSARLPCHSLITGVLSKGPAIHSFLEIPSW
jgi:hypothetical protein